jgi:hypothetical protein
MPTIPLYYTIVDINGDIFRSQITDDPNYPVGEGQRLVKDQLPEYDSEKQCVFRVTPVPAEQDYVEYQIKDITYTDEELFNLVNISRNRKLQLSDWTQLPDVPLTESQVNSWREYRQELRDVTEQAGYPKNIIWPVEPE